MAVEVYANGEEIACKKGDGKVIAAFPDVCLSPPSPPAGPIPVPYPNTSFSKDMKNGSKKVKIKGGPVMLKNKSFYKSSPLGDEAATRSFGASVITHQITGKTYFNAWSMDVKFEGKNVPRHIDLATSNHASYPGSAPPNPNMSKVALDRIKAGKCPCCGKAEHAFTKSDGTVTTEAVDVSGTPMNMNEWYGKRLAASPRGPAKKKAAAARLKKLLADAKARPNPCPTCRSKKTRISPQAPCDVFFPPKASRHENIKNAWKTYKKTSTYQARNGIKSIAETEVQLGTTDVETVNKARKVNHLTPKVAGGCPTGGKNLQPNRQLCGPCQTLDDKFNEFQ